jgi:hypothetical protein
MDYIERAASSSTILLGHRKTLGPIGQTVNSRGSLAPPEAYLWGKQRADERTRTADLLITSDK